MSGSELKVIDDKKSNLGADKLKNLHFVICVENSVYRTYLDNAFTKDPRVSANFVTKKLLASAVTENSNVVLLLQSDSDEYELIEIATKLKRVFSDEIKIILLSSDYKLADQVYMVADKFMQFPIQSEKIIDAAFEIDSPLKKVLLIDDSKLVHKTIVDGMKDAGFTVYQAFDGQDGYDQALEIKPAVIICDIEMPKMNGYETCDAVRRNDNLANTHIIMSSTLGSAADQKKGFQVGVDEYITKPVDLAKLIARIEKVFNKAHSRRESILILNQSNHLTRTMAKALSQQGFTIRNADRIKSAIKSLSRLSCDLMLVESVPTDGSIIDLFNNINNLKKDNKPDVIVTIPNESEADARMALNAGAVGALEHPFNMDGMLAMVERALADRRARKEKEQLGRYVSQASMRMAVEKAILGTAEEGARADRKSASIFFSDIANFTDRCERYSPKEIVEQINLLFGVMTSVIIENRGDIDKFIGDACMAFWLDDGTHNSNNSLLKSVLEMQEQIKIMNMTHPVLIKDPIVVRMGANTGEVILCDIGATEARVDLTIIGDPVNVAARLESASKQYGTTNLVSEFTLNGFKEKYCYRIIDKVRVKGKSSPLICYELLTFTEKKTKEIIELKEAFEDGFSLYQKEKFEQAKAKFSHALELERNSSNDVNPSKLYISRCDKLIINPPKDWDGVWSLTEK